MRGPFAVFSIIALMIFILLGTGIFVLRTKPPVPPPADSTLTESKCAILLQTLADLSIKERQSNQNQAKRNTELSDAADLTIKRISQNQNIDATGQFNSQFQKFEEKMDYNDRKDSEAEKRIAIL